MQALQGLRYENRGLRAKTSRWRANQNRSQ